MIKTPRSEITAYLWACSYCGSSKGTRDPKDESFCDESVGCCSETAAHFVKAYLVSGHDDLVLEDEIEIYD